MTLRAHDSNRTYRLLVEHQQLGIVANRFSSAFGRQEYWDILALRIDLWA